MKARRFVLASMAILFLAAPGPADDTPTVVVTQTDDSKFPEITVYYEVKRPDRSFLLDAARADFRVAEDGQDRPIARFEAPESLERRPTTIVLVLDQSGSMKEEERMDALKRSVATFLQGLPPGSRVAAIAFSSEVNLICPFTTDRARVLEAVNALEPGGATRYYDAVSIALDLLEAEPGRRAVLALTDGQDARSLTMTLPKAVAKARKLNLPVHTLGLGDERSIAVKELRRLAEETRGQHYLARDAGQLKAIYEEIARRIGSTYSLTYRTDREVPDGTLRPIRITYRQSEKAGETAVFVRGMVVPTAGWSRLFLGLMTALVALACLPGWIKSRKTFADVTASS